MEGGRGSKKIRPRPIRAKNRERELRHLDFMEAGWFLLSLFLALAIAREDVGYSNEIYGFQGLCFIGDLR